MNEDFSQEIEVAKRLAREAGARILAHYNDGFAVDYKGHDDPVTQADRDANHIIVEGLASAFPADAILAEESKNTDSRHAHARLWCVDPLDGTQELVNRNGEFSVMIGLAVRGEARVGVVYQPTEDTLWAGAGTLATVERRGGPPTPLTPSRCIDPTKAVLVGSRSHTSKGVAEVATALGVARQDRLGSVGLKMARVAEGGAELYLSMSTQTHEWDACAPEAILRAAGGFVTDCFGAPLRYNKQTTNTPRGMLATNALIHAAVLAAARSVVEARFGVTRASSG
jgi:3'(2'), 5'-bisphosphate nucleotidase